MAAFDPAIISDIMNSYASSNAMITSDLDNVGETEEETAEENETMMCKRVVTRDRRYITQITCYEKDGGGGAPPSRNAFRLPVFGKQTSGSLASLFQFPRRRAGTTIVIHPPENTYTAGFIFVQIFA